MPELRTQEFLNILRGNEEFDKLSTDISLLKKYIKTYPLEIADLYFNTLISRSDSANNPFTINYHFGVSSKTTNYHGIKNDNLSMRIATNGWNYLANLVIRKIANSNKEPIENSEEYFPLTKYIEKHFNFGTKQICSAVDLTTDSVAEFRLNLRNLAEINLGNSISRIYKNIYRGLPVYRKNDLGRFLKIPESDPDFIYLFMCGYYENLKNDTTYSLICPRWAYKYCFKKENLIIFQEYYDANNIKYCTDDEKTIQIKRSSFLKEIGEKDLTLQATNNGKQQQIAEDHTKSRLLVIQEKVLERYYGDQFDITDRSTWTTQETIVLWLKKEYDLSKREATAIDIVTRPDEIRGK